MEQVPLCPLVSFLSEHDFLSTSLYEDFLLRLNMNEAAVRAHAAEVRAIPGFTLGFGVSRVDGSEDVYTWRLMVHITPDMVHVDTPETFAAQCCLTGRAFPLTLRLPFNYPRSPAAVVGNVHGDKLAGFAQAAFNDCAVRGMTGEASRTSAPACLRTLQAALVAGFLTSCGGAEGHFSGCGSNARTQKLYFPVALALSPLSSWVAPDALWVPQPQPAPPVDPAAAPPALGLDCRNCTFRNDSGFRHCQACNEPLHAAGAPCAYCTEQPASVSRTLRSLRVRRCLPPFLPLVCCSFLSSS